jgi:hypothetical protein
MAFARNARPRTTVHGRSAVGGRRSAVGGRRSAERAVRSRRASSCRRGSARSAAGPGLRLRLRLRLRPGPAGWGQPSASGLQPSTVSPGPAFPEGRPPARRRMPAVGRATHPQAPQGRSPDRPVAPAPGGPQGRGPGRHLPNPARPAACARRGAAAPVARPRPAGLFAVRKAPRPGTGIPEVSRRPGLCRTPDHSVPPPPTANPPTTPPPPPPPPHHRPPRSPTGPARPRPSTHPPAPGRTSSPRPPALPNPPAPGPTHPANPANTGMPRQGPCRGRFREGRGRPADGETGVRQTRGGVAGAEGDRGPVVTHVSAAPSVSTPGDLRESPSPPLRRCRLPDLDHVRRGRPDGPGGRGRGVRRGGGRGSVL